MSAIIKREYEYMTIRKVCDKTKTSVFRIASKHGGILGGIRWRPAWRRYCFLPEGETVFSSGCLDDISSFINELMEERRNQK